MNRASQVTFLALAVLVVLFVLTWLTIPSQRSDAVGPPASLFLHGISGPAGSICIDWEPTGLGQADCARRAPIGSLVDLDELEQRVRYTFGGAAVVIVLVGLAFGAGRRAAH